MPGLPVGSSYPKGFMGGVAIQEMPVLNHYPNRVFWVDSSASLAGDGTFNRPYSTIAAAYAKCTASRGDQIHVKPGHTESITAAGGITLSKIGVSIIGHGRGRLRPKLTWTTATTATLLVSAAQNSISNFVFDGTSLDAIASMVAVQAADFQLWGCEFILAGASAQATLGILTTAAADRMTIQSCAFRGTADAGTTAAVRIVGGDGIIIQDNLFLGAYGSGNGAIENITTASTNIMIIGNLINNVTAVSTKAIVAVAGTTGIIANNRMQILSGTAPITAAGASWVGGNYYAATIATAGTLI